MDKFERFEKWLRENGADFQMLELRAYDDIPEIVPYNDSIEEKKETTKEREQSMFGSSADSNNSINEESEMRGVISKGVIDSNTVCVSIPRKCLITVEMGQLTDIGQAIVSSDLDLDAPKHIFLMIYILWDRKINGSKSFFKPYYDILPKTLRNMPVFWSDDELEYLKGSYLLSQISDRNEAITDDYFAICDVAPQLKAIASLDEFKWARMCVCSRNFGLQIDGYRTSALVPHADMLNHYRPRETKWTFDNEKQAFTITSLQSIQAGAQVYDSYGQKCNHRFLLNYGFAVEDNREIDGYCPNEVPIELGISSEDPLFDRKFDFWSRGEGGGGNINISLSGIAAQHGMSGVSALTTARSQNSDQTAVVQSFLDATAADQLRHNVSILCEREWASNDENSSPSLKRVRVSISNNENTRILFSVLRVVVSNEEELNAIMTSPSTSLIGEIGGSGQVSRALLGFHGESSGTSLASQQSLFHRTCRDIRHPLSIRNEKYAMQHLLVVVRNALNLYPTTLTQDIIDLSDEMSYPRFSNRRHAKIQVKGEKEILHHFDLWARTALDVIDIIENEIATNREEWKVGKMKNRQSFECAISSMEDAAESEGERGLHHTIIRYCCDTLGSIRREELKTPRRPTTKNSHISTVFGATY